MPSRLNKPKITLVVLMSLALFGFLSCVAFAAHKDESTRSSRPKKHGHEVKKTKKSGRHHEDGLSRQQKRILDQLDSTGATSPEELESQAKEFLQQGNVDMTLRRYSTIVNYFPEYKPDEELLLIVAGIQYHAGEPEDALATARIFGEKHPDSPKMNNMVELAFELGKNYCVATDDNYRVFSRESKALDAFEFVKENDPYSNEAAEALYSISAIHMRKSEWEEAESALKELEKRQPATAIAGDAEVAIAECRLGMNKGAYYSRENMDQALKDLKSYQQRFPKGEKRQRAEKLLSEAYTRLGMAEMAVARLYCSHRKWTSAKIHLKDLLADETMKDFHSEAGELLEAIEGRYSPSPVQTSASQPSGALEKAGDAK